MGVVTVKVYAKNDTPTADPIADVLMRIFDETGATFVTSGSTNASGLFQFDVNGGFPPVRYQVRPSKIGCSFSNPEIIDVYDPAVPANNFEIYGNIHELSPAIGGVRFCRVQGFVYDIGGRPLVNSVVRFGNKFLPIVVDGVAVLGNVEVRTDSTGWMAAELYRKGRYSVTISGMHENAIDVEVPDRDSILLTDLVFPVVASVTFAPPAPWSVPLGATVTLTPTVVSSGYITLSGSAHEDVVYSSGDTSVATVHTEIDTIKITGRSLGSTTLEIARADTTIKRVPDVPITGSGGVINVV